MTPRTWIARALALLIAGTALAGCVAYPVGYGYGPGYGYGGGYGHGGHGYGGGYGGWRRG